MARTTDFVCKKGDFRLTAHQTLLPAGWERPKGYANGVSAQGRLVFTAGIVGWDEQQRFVSDDMVGQFEQVLANTVAILAEAGALPRSEEHTSELQSLMRISYAVFCLKKKKIKSDKRIQRNRS